MLGYFKFIFAFVFLFILVSSFVSAGIGLKWSQESQIIQENGESCLTYSVYNPYPQNQYVKIGVSEELNPVLTEQEKESQEIPAETSSEEAIPVEFCFKVPRVYSRDCWIGNYLFCKQTCTEEPKLYAGKVVVSSVSSEALFLVEALVLVLLWLLLHR